MVLLVVTAIVLLTLDGRGAGPVSAVRNAVLEVLSPVGDLGSAILSPITNAWNNAFDRTDLEKENEQLREEVDRLSGEVIATDLAREQIRQLLELSGIPFVGDTPRVRARVVGSGVGNFGRTVELDRGSSSGIRRNMPVVTGEGLIGKVVEVSDSRAVVALLTGGTFRVAFNVIGTSAIGTVEGTGSPTVLRGGSIDVRQTVEVGQLLVTSGLSGSPYPPGIPIGTISAVRTDLAARETTIDVIAFASTDDLFYADVLLWAPEG